MKRSRPRFALTRFALTRFALPWLACAALAACHPADDDVAPTDARDAAAQETALQAKRITIGADGLDRAQIQELTEAIEGLGDIAMAKVKVMQRDAGDVEIHVEVAGNDLPTDDELVAEVRRFPGFASAAVGVQTLSPDEVGPDPLLGDGPGSDDDKTPEQIKAEVIENLRAQGVQGDVQVDVHDEDGERRVEVRVESHDDSLAKTP